MASNPRYFTEGMRDTDAVTVRHDRLGGRYRLQHGPPLSPDSLGALVDSKDSLRVGHREARGRPPLLGTVISAVKVVADTFQVWQCT